MRFTTRSLLLAGFLVLAISSFASLGDTTKTPVRANEVYLNNEGFENPIAEKLTRLNRHAPFDFVLNDVTESYIKMYTQRRSTTSTILALGELYFPMFEKILSEYGLPHQLKYLAVVESSLQAKAKSYAAATGLWQFMPTTGKIYGLRVNSLVDERSDPIKATHAACRYLKSLYDIFGTWDLALSAYNSGPATVSRAIRQSGGKRNFWEIYDYLPRETKGYVPAFIAVNYIMNYYEDYGINLGVPEFTHCDIEHIELNKNANLSEIAEAIDEPLSVLRFLNPSLKTNSIPASATPYTLVLPKDKKELFSLRKEGMSVPVLETKTKAKTSKKGKKGNSRASRHTVRKGETLFSISKKYNCSVDDLKKWNKFKGSKLSLGQKLVINSSQKEEEQEEVLLAETKNPKTSSKQSQPAAEKKPEISEEDQAKATHEQIKPDDHTADLGQYATYHVVQRGDTLWSICRKYDGLTVTELKKMNNLNTGSLKPGQKLIVNIGG